MSAPDPVGLLEQVTDQTSFLTFVKALAEDARENRDEWENATIADYLASAAAWAEDSDFGASQGLSRQNPWRRFAVLLYTGKIYE